MPTYNPISSVQPCNESGTATGAAVTTLPAPTVYRYGMKDISGVGAGRTEDMVMHKKRKGRSRTVELAWNNISVSSAATVVTAFDSEYVLVTCLDLKTGTWLTHRYYVTDRNSPLYSGRLGLWESVSFSIIQQDAVI